MPTEVMQASQGRSFAVTDRRDLWWLPPLGVVLGLGGFGLYATFRAFYNADYVVDIATSAYLLSPFYSPLIVWDGMPAWLSPAFLILWAPLGMRLTCYYYRKAYYRAFFQDPTACAVGEFSGRKYRGETRLLILQNVHRYFFYFAVVFCVILTIDAIHACLWPDGFGISIGTLVLAANAALLTLYTFSCHSFRHLIGGNVDCFSCVRFGQSRYKLWRSVSTINENHMFWAWTSLFMVGFSDFYVWMVASGNLTDFRLI